MVILYDNFAILRQLKDLFPTKLTGIIFIAYMILFINHGLLITSTKTSDNHYNYDPTLIVIITEYLKLFGSIAIYLNSNTFIKLLYECNIHKSVFLKYFIPAFLYCLYNNLQFTNLAQYDPATYFILLQFRVVVTGVIYQILFARKLTSTQWLSLFILTFGCIIKQMKPGVGANLSMLDSMISLLSSLQLDRHLLLILVQILCSCFAGVYNEFLLKNKASSSPSSLQPTPQPNLISEKVDDGDDTLLLIGNTDKSTNQSNAAQYQSKDVPIMVQNVYMYLASIICNYLYLLLSPGASITTVSSSPSTTLSVSPPSNFPILFNGTLPLEPKHPTSFVSLLLHDWRISAIIVNGACIGLVTSFFLKYLDSILKNFASALEIIFTAILANFLFGIAIGPNTVIATVLVCYAVYLYSRNPVRRA